MRDTTIKKCVGAIETVTGGDGGSVACLVR